VRLRTPFDARSLFPEVRERLLATLEALIPSDWAVPSLCPGWSIKDVALHVLADDLGYLSRRRDGFSVPNHFDGWDDLVTFINELNESWVAATRRLSPRIVRDLLRFSGGHLHDYLATRDLEAPSAPIAWAGPDPVPTWLQIAREYTEYWMHYQHIGVALGRRDLHEPRYLTPLFETFAYALPRAMGDATVELGATVRLVIRGAGGGAWDVVQGDRGWELSEGRSPAAAVVGLSVDDAWRMYTKGLDEASLRARAAVEGDSALGERLLGAVGILA
jgi:uncharacterized protein (TIGR03083 family)